MNLYIVLAAGYFVLLFLISRLSSGRGTNDAFYRGERRSPWYAVGFGMLGASLSGVSFVSVPGMVQGADMGYLQMCMGFIPGYILVALVLLPLYYHNNVTSIYSYLEDRLGVSAHRTGASFFLLSKSIGAALRLYLVCAILQTYIFESLQIPFWMVAMIVLILIWSYTSRGGIRSIVWTDCLQTLIMLLALVAIIYQVLAQFDAPTASIVQMVQDSSMSRIFHFDDPTSKAYFWKQFLSGIFIVVVMTGLDQDMMQKNLSCKNLRESKRNMISYGMLFLPFNFLFLVLGILLILFAQSHAIALPERSDDILPVLCSSGVLGRVAELSFFVGIVAACFSSADSALTSLTTCFCVDVVRRPADERLRRWTHPVISMLFLLVILLFRYLNSTSVIDAVYTVCSYTYGPLLGLFAYAILPHRTPRGRWIPLVCLVSPVLCWGINEMSKSVWGYQFGYELLMLNGLLTYVGLWLISVGGTQRTR